MDQIEKAIIKNALFMQDDRTACLQMLFSQLSNPNLCNLDTVTEGYSALEAVLKGLLLRVLRLLRHVSGEPARPNNIKARSKSTEL